MFVKSPKPAPLPRMCTCGQTVRPHGAIKTEICIEGGSKPWLSQPSSRSYSFGEDFGAAPEGLDIRT
jgi:hypothetical protein